MTIEGFVTLAAPANVSDAELRLIADSIPHIVFMAGPDGSTEYFNEQGRRYTGVPAEMNFGWDWLAQVHPDDVDLARETWERATRSQTSYRIDYRLQRFDGDYRWHAVRALPIRDERGAVLKWIGTATDIDDAKRLENDLRTAERSSAETLGLLEALQSKAPVGFGFVDRDFVIVRSNETLATMRGSTAAEQIGRTVAAVVPHLWQQLEPLYRGVLATGEAVLDVEIDGPVGPQAVHRYWLVSYYPVRVADEIIGVGSVVVDLTARKRAEEAMRFQAELLAASGQAIVAVDLDRIVTYWNRAAEEMYGWSSDEAVGRKSTDLIARTESAERAHEMLEALLAGQNWSADYEVTRRDGGILSVYVTNRPVFDHRGQLVAVIGSSVDVTERKAAEEARRQLSAIIDGSGDAIFGVSLDGIVTSWNGAAERMFGYTAAEIIGQPVATIAPPGATVEQTEMRGRLIAGSRHELLETTRVRKDGSSLDVLITASSTRDEAGRITGLSVIAQDINERLTSQRALEASRRGLAEAQRIAHLGSFELDLVTGISTWSEEYYRILGVDPAVKASTQLLASMVHPDDMPEMQRLWADVLELGVPFDYQFRLIRPDSQQRHVHALAFASLTDDRTVVALIGTLMDITDRVEADAVRRAAETRFEIGFEQSAIGAAIADLDGVPTRVNKALCAILGRSEDQLIGRRWTDYTHPDELPLGQVVMARLAAGQDTHQDERRYLLPDGSVVWAMSHVTLVRDEAGTPQYAFLQLQDITGRKQMEEDIAHQALHDSLTGLPNRALLTDRLVHGLAGSRRRGSQLGVMFLDIDHFKVVNDSMGHNSGDDLLRHAADTIAGAIRPGDTVARFGGDEFVVVCDDVSLIETEQIAERVLHALAQPWYIENQEMNLTASLGIAVADLSSTPDSLLRDSDAAMYRAKRRGRGRIELFDETLRSKAEGRLAIASALHHALERQELEVHYQPVIDLRSGQMVSAEALLRWDHPVRGRITPDEFIPLAEETGLIVPIGAWLLEHVCRQLVDWQQIQPSAAPEHRLSVAVNLSVRQMLAPDVAGLLASVLSRSGLRPGDLCLELTESVFMEDVEYFGTTLAGLKDIGVDLAIDDFGTGYSSLSYLKRFPVDAVKVDRAFVDGLGSDPHDTALVAAIVAMAGALDLQVTAEGVETREQLLGLKRLGVPRAQGFYLAMPMPADEMTDLIRRSHRWDVG